MTENLKERIAELARVDILARADDADLAAVAAICVERRYQPGEVIFRLGEEGESVLICLEGWVHCTRAGVEITEIGPGETFGLSSFLDHGPRPVDAVARGPVRLLSLERGPLTEVIARHPRVMEGLSSVMTRHLRSVISIAATQRALRG